MATRRRRCVCVRPRGVWPRTQHAVTMWAGQSLCTTMLPSNNITVQNPELFSKIPIPLDGNDSDEECPIFYNNSEVVRVAFMQQTNVQHFQEAITEKEPFGVFRYRWGDALARFATMAIFATPDTLIGGKSPGGYRHRRCPQAVISSNSAAACFRP